MKLFFTTFVYLLSFGILRISANVEQELRKSIDKAMKCPYNDPPKDPVMAVSPARFAQVVVILHEKFHTPTCGRSPNSPIQLNDEKTWPFCVFGRCSQGRCRCAGSFEGPKCGTYTKKCWLMYCYLTSCHPVHQTLHCICDPKLYGTYITSGMYWYNEGRSSNYMPPPKGWEDEPFEMIKLRNNAALQMGSSGQNRAGGPPGQRQNGQGSRPQNLSEGKKNLNPPQNWKGVQSSNQRPNGKQPGVAASGSKPLGLMKAGSSVNGIGSSEARTENKGGIKKFRNQDYTESDVEEALDEVVEASSASKLINVGKNLIIFFVLHAQWILRIYLT